MKRKKKRNISRYQTPKGAPDLKLLRSRLILALKNYMDYDDEDEYADRILLDVFKHYKQHKDQVKADIKWAFSYLLDDSPTKAVRTPAKVKRAKKKSNELAKQVWKSKK